MVELKVTFTDDITKMSKEIVKELKKIPQEAFSVFKANTPVRTGNAKRNTKLQGSTIKADYNYAEVLDKGRHMTTRGMRGSEQAPQGMTKPTEDYVINRVNQIMRGK